MSTAAGGTYRVGRRKARPAIRLGLVALLATATVVAGRAAWMLPEARRLSDAAQPYRQQPDHPQRRLLVVGDSTALGTGASAPQFSVGGRIGRDHPGWQIDNRARNGARLRDVAAQIRAAPGPVDVVLVMAGGNDVMRASGDDAMADALRDAVHAARSRRAQVVLLPCGLVGRAPPFLPPLSWWLDARSARLHELVAQAATAPGVRYVDIRRPREVDPFVNDPRRFHAADGLHPSDDGYALWHQQLVASGALD